MDKSFLLPSSFIFDDSNLIDNIRQTFLDLQFHADEHSVQDFLNEALSYLCKDYQIEVANELLPVISLCFSLYPQYSLPLAAKFLKSNKSNEYLIISSIIVVFELTNNKTKIDFLDYYSFIDDCLKEILPQIQKQDSTKLIIFSQEISQQYHNSLILDLLLSTKLTEELFSNFFSYVLKKNLFLTNLKFDFLLKKLIEADFVKILPLTESSTNDLLKIIAMKSINLFDNFCWETLLFISQVANFTRTEGKSDIKGLTEEAVLPFVSITSIYYRSSQFEFTFSEQTLKKLLMESIQNLNDKNSTKLNIESINFILKNLDLIESNKLISSSTMAEIITILVQKIIKNEFTVDKSFLLSLLFGYFLKNSDELEPNIKQFVQNEGKSLLEYIFNNLDELNNCIKLQKLNLSIFEKSMLTNFLENKIKSEKQVQMIYFLENFCLKVPNFTISPEILGKVEQNNWEVYLTVARFLKKNLKDDVFKNIKETLPKNILFSLSDEIPEKEMNIDELLSYILTDSHNNLDKSSKLLNLLFDKMIDDKQILQYYLLYKIDNSCTCTNKVTKFLSYYIDQYEKYHKDFIEAVNQRFYYNEIEEKNIPNTNFKLDDLPIPESGICVIDKLFKYANENKATYQLFLCLKNIACSFPFLYKNYSKQIFDLVLPNIDYLYLLFDQNSNEKSIELSKIAYSSLSFLFSTLKLPNILEEFLDWMISNIFSFTNSQILGFIIILIYLSANTDLYKILAIIVNKYDLFEILKILFDREIEEGKYFDSFYKENICLLITQILFCLTTITESEFKDVISCQELDHPILEFFNKFTKKLPNIQISSPIQNKHFPEKIQEFIINIDDQREFWIYNNSDQIFKRKPNDYQIYSFVKELKVNNTLTFNDESDDENCDNSFNYIKSYSETLFMMATMESINEKLYSMFENAFIQIASNDISMISSYINFIISYFTKYDENDNGSDSPFSIRVMRHMIDILSIFAQSNKMTLTEANKILLIVLNPKWRNNSDLLKEIVCLLRFYSSLPVSSLHAIEFDILQNKIIGERDIETFWKICDTEIKQSKVNQYYKHYAELGKKTAITMYGILIKDGICQDADIPKSLTYIKKAMEFEDPTAIAYYALMLYDGEGVDKNVDESIKLFQKAADNGSDIAMNSYGKMLEEGNNVEKNLDKAVSYYKKAIDEKNMRSLYNFGKIVLKDHEHRYLDTENNVDKASLFFKKAADQGILDSIYEYGKFKDEAEYVVKAIKKGYQKAIKYLIYTIIGNKELYLLPSSVEWLQKGIELGIKECKLKLAKCIKVNNIEGLEFDYTLLDAANDNDIDAMTEYHHENWKKLRNISYTDADIPYQAKNYINILKQYKKDNTKVFVDDFFPPFKNWKRIDEIYDAPLFKRELIDPSFIIQGDIGNCCLISALSRVAKQYYLIPELFDYHSPNKILGVVENSMNIKCGAVVVKLRKNGNIIPVLIDTLIPVTDEGIPFLSHPIDKTKSPWFCLVEKAFIKLVGSFVYIDGISFERSLYCMYFTYSKKFQISGSGLNTKAIDCSTNTQCSLTFDKINEYYNNGCVIDAGIEKNISENKLKGLVDYHSYLIYNLGSYKGMNFVCLRNPWGEGEWEGKFSRTDNLIPDDVKNFLDYDHLQPGIFWMSFEDFFKNYNTITILKPVPSDWHIKSFYILLQKLENNYDFQNLETYGIKIKQQIPKGKKCRLQFLVEKDATWIEPYPDNYRLIIASINENEPPKIDFSKIKDEKHFSSFTGNKFVDNYSFDITENNEIVYVTAYLLGKHGTCCVNVMCKYDFDLYRTDDPDNLINEVNNNPRYVFTNTSKHIKINNFDNKLEFSFDTMNPDDCSNSEERDEYIGNLIKYQKLDFKIWKDDINLYEKIQEKPLGNGTNEPIFLVKKKTNNELYAAKILNSSTDLKFIRELSILGSLRYPSIIDFIAYDNKDFEDKDHPTIITKNMKIGSLYDFIKKVHIGTCKWNSTDKMIILIGIAFGMNYLRNHEIMHSDLNLRNILLDDDMTPKIFDFAKSKNFKFDIDNGQVEAVGTPLFMAPEIKNKSCCTFKIDVYSFGVIAYYIYTNQIPDESHPVDMNKLNPKFKKFVSSMIDEDPNKRPTFKEIINMYLKRFDETWIDGTDIEKVEIYIHKLGFTLPDPKEDQLKLNLIRSITPEFYSESAKNPIVKIDDIMESTLLINLKKANTLLQNGGADNVKDIKEADSIFSSAGNLFYGGLETADKIILHKDLFYAIQFFRESSLLNNSESMYKLSKILSQSDNKECQKIASKLKIMSVNLGDYDALFSFADFYLEGTDKNLIMAALYFKLGADLGYNEHQYYFGDTLIKIKKELHSEELKNQIEKAQKIVYTTKGMSCRFYKQFLLLKNALYNPVITNFVAYVYLVEGSEKGSEKAVDSLELIDYDEIELYQKMPDFVNEIALFNFIQADSSLSVDEI